MYLDSVVKMWELMGRRRREKVITSISGNANYAATVVRVDELHALEKLDKLKGLRALGYQALVSSTAEPGSLLVVFVAGSALSLDYATKNNLHRHQNLNADPAKTGYLEDNRRVKAITLRGNRSDALAMPIESLEPLLGYVPDIAHGVQFDTIDGIKICEKFTTRRESSAMSGKGAVKKSLVSEEQFPEHYDTDQFARNRHEYSPSDHVVVSQKLHGTSVRFGSVHVARKLSWVERLAKRFGARVAESEPSFVVGSRRVTKSVNGETKPGEHFYADDLWTASVAHLKEAIPPGFIVYGELIGWTGEKPIQKNYTYDLPFGKNELYVYRVTSINEHGDQFDLSWRDMDRFCAARGMKMVPVLWRGTFAEFEAVEPMFLDARFADKYSGALPLSNAKTVDEGICIWSQNGVVTKHKSPIFLGHESKMLDDAAEDIEEVEAQS
jgi:hypothetical protein